jgi:hypothetical protein
MSKLTDSLDLHYYRDAVQRSTECMAASSERECKPRRVPREPCVSIYMPENRCSVDGHPDNVRIDWGTPRST